VPDGKVTVHCTDTLVPGATEEGGAVIQPAHAEFAPQKRTANTMMLCRIKRSLARTKHPHRPAILKGESAYSRLAYGTKIDESREKTFMKSEFKDRVCFLFSVY
jgi:hypothetical protein